MVAPNDVDVVVAHLALLPDLLRVAPLGAHLRHHVENHLEGRRAEVRGGVVAGETRVYTAEEALVVQQVDLQCVSQRCKISF